MFLVPLDKLFWLVIFCHVCQEDKMYQLQNNNCRTLKTGKTMNDGNFHKTLKYVNSFNSLLKILTLYAYDSCVLVIIHFQAMPYK